MQSRLHVELVDPASSSASENKVAARTQCDCFRWRFRGILREQFVRAFCFLFEIPSVHSTIACVARGNAVPVTLADGTRARVDDRGEFQFLLKSARFEN